MYYNYTGVLRNIQRRLHYLQNISFDKKIDEFGHFCPAWWSKMYLFVAILENGRHLGFSIDQSDGMDLITIEMSHANVGACIIICTIHPKNANYLLHSKSVTTCPNATITTCPNVISLTKFSIVETRCTLHLATYIQGSVYSLNQEHVYIHNILVNYNNV